MQRLDHVTVTALECRAPGQSTNDLAFVHGQVQEGALFHAFNERERDTMLDVLKSSDGLVPSFHTFFEDLKFLQIWGQCAKTLKRVRPRGAGPGGTVFTALEQAFDGTHQHIDHCVIQQSEFVFTIIPGTIADRVDLGYRQLFLYVMRHHREMIPGSTRMELKGRKKLMEAINVPKEVDRLAWCRFAVLADRLGFASAEIASLKSPDATAAAVEVPSGRSNPPLVSADSDESCERRCGRPFDLAYEQSQDGLFLDHVHRLDKSHGRGITPFFVRRSVYLAFLGRPPLAGQPGQTELPPSPSPAAESKLEEMHGEPMDESAGPNHVAWPQDWSRRWQAQINETVRRLETRDGHSGSKTPSITGSSSYSTDHDDLQDSPSVHRRIDLGVTVSPKVRVKFVLRRGDGWVDDQDVLVDPSDPSPVERVAEEHTRNGRFLFHTNLRSLAPSQCFGAVVGDGTSVVLVIPEGSLNLDQQLSVSARNLGVNVEGQARNECVEGGH